MGHGIMGRTVVNFAGMVVALAGAASVAVAQDYGFGFVTIGDPGNRDTVPEEVPQWPELEVGGVEFEYRIMRTELTVGQQFEYVTSYWEHVPLNERGSRSFLGLWIRPAGPPEDPRYYIVQGAEHRPAAMSWRHTARFANWLHNGKADEQWAFEDGAYDTSTFGYNNDGTLTDQPEHHPDARFWIPTMDEYAKAMFWDPPADGGEGKYWMFPHSKDVAPIPGAPWNGGETNAGLHPDDVPYLDVGSYPWAASPWGLLDGSGGQPEWMENLADGHYDRVWHGSIEYGSFHDLFDRVDWWSGTDAEFIDLGVRLAPVVPSAGTWVTALTAWGVGCAPWKRRRE